MSTDKINFITAELKKAGKLALSRFGKLQKVEFKSSRTDFLTQTDIEIHGMIKSALSELFPNEPLISEEDIENHNLTKPDAIPNHAYWILDPVDGTNNFASGVPLFGIMLARAEGKTMTHSGIYLPVEDSLYLAQRNKGATRNGKKISCTKNTSWPQTFGCTNASLNPKKEKLRKALFQAATKDSFWLNAFGSAAISGCYIADGRRDWYFSMGSHLWDYAPIVLLMEEAGCTVTDFSGEKWVPGKRELLAAHKPLHETLLALL